jgi:hypothetical protein
MSRLPFEDFLMDGHCGNAYASGTWWRAYDAQKQHGGNE